MNNILVNYVLGKGVGQVHGNHCKVNGAKAFAKGEPIKVSTGVL